MNANQMSCELKSDQNSNNRSIDEDLNHKEGKTSRSPTPTSRRNSNLTQNNINMSKTPRYVRNTTLSNASNSNSNVTSAVSSPVQRKLLNKQQQNQRYVKRGQTSEKNYNSNDSIGGNVFARRN